MPEIISPAITVKEKSGLLMSIRAREIRGIIGAAEKMFGGVEIGEVCFIEKTGSLNAITVIPVLKHSYPKDG
jgi:hypothetical protein